MTMELAACVVAAALKVRRKLGLGQAPAAYRNALCTELERQRLHVRRSVALTGIARGCSAFDKGNTLELVVQEQLILELKTLETLYPIHDAQVVTLLRLSEQDHALLLNFGEPYLRHGIRHYSLKYGQPLIRPWVNPPPRSEATQIAQIYRQRIQLTAKSGGEGRGNL